MIHAKDEDRWRDLEANAHLPEVQEIIRQEILSGIIRVRPKPQGGICIVPIGVGDSEEVRDMEPPPAPIQEDPSPLTRAVRRRLFARRR